MIPPEYLRLRDVARLLGCTKKTVAKRVKEGLLPSTQFGPGVTSPRYVSRDAVSTLLRLTRVMESPSPLPGVTIDPFEAQYMLLNRRLGRLAAVIGREPVEAMLLKHSADGGFSLSDVHPREYGKVQRDALLLSRGILPRAKNPGMSKVMREYWARKHALAGAEAAD